MTTRSQPPSNITTSKNDEAKMNKIKSNLSVINFLYKHDLVDPQQLKGQWNKAAAVKNAAQIFLFLNCIKTKKNIFQKKIFTTKNLFLFGPRI